MRNIWIYLVGAAVLVIALGFFVWPGKETPVTPMAQARDEVAPTGNALAEVTLPDALSAKAEIGKTAYDATCAKCHGANAAGQDGVAPPLVHKIYEPSHHGDEAFWIATQRGVQSHHWRFGNMPRIEGLARADVLGIVAYVRELQRVNGIN